MARGSVFKKDGAWAFRIDVGTDLVTGRRRQSLRQGFSTRKEAEAALAKHAHAAATGGVVAKSSQKLSEYLDDWLVTQRQRLRATTLTSYDDALKRVRTGLGNVPLQALTPMQLEKFYAELVDLGSKARIRLSPKTVRNTHTVLRKALADAERLGLIYRNPAASARPPSAARPEFTTWSSDEVKEFFAAVADDRLFGAWVLLATTGMRRGEALGLRWKDVDFDAAQLAVVQTLTAVDAKPVFSPPKTVKSRRTIYLDAQTVLVLKEHRKRQREERLAAGEAWDASGDLVFRDELGRLVHPDWFSREFRRLLASTGLPHIRLHDLRHTHATLALKAGVHPKVVSERLGHTTVGITLDLYSHVTPGIARDAADAVAAKIFG